MKAKNICLLGGPLVERFEARVPSRVEGLPFQRDAAAQMWVWAGLRSHFQALSWMPMCTISQRLRFTVDAAQGIKLDLMELVRGRTR